MDTEMSSQPGEAEQKETARAFQLARHLECLYGISHLVEAAGASLEGILSGIPILLIEAFPESGLTNARIRLNSFEFEAGAARTRPPCLNIPITVTGEDRGAIEITYTGDEPSPLCASLQADERLLLESVSERLGRLIERTEAERALRDMEQFVITASE
ncbi:MAG: hypothetical protein CVU59_13545, partial [Deltaproteobacteria bacterium HGW-Deltaproteobacteria-17]